jgi:hypothetical protein
MFVKHHMILQLTRNSLVACTNKDEQAKLDLPVSVVRNLDVLDSAKLAELVGGFASRYGLRGKKLVLVLDDSVVFQKVVPLTPGQDTMAMQTDFQDKLPFAADAKRTLTLKLKNQLVMLGASGEYYLQVVQALINKGVKVTSVSPLAVFAKGATHLTAEIVDRVAHNHHLTNVANFLNLDRKK